MRRTKLEHAANSHQIPHKLHEYLEKYFIKHKQKQDAGFHNRFLHLSHPKAKLPVAADHTERQRPVPTEA